MPRARFNRGIFVVEALNSLGTSFYFNYLFFFLKSEFGFTNTQNLLVAALNGFIYVPFALYGGKLGQRRGYLFALGAGLSLMCVAHLTSAFLRTPGWLIAVMCLWTVGMCFTWPNLEALACDKQSPKDLPKVIGMYNIVWSGAGAVAYFCGGAVATAFGWRSLFWIPAAIHAIQIGLVLFLQPRWRALPDRSRSGAADLHESHPEGPAFLKMAWLANPFAYIAINATIPLMPDLANRFHLSPAFAGFFCSIWFFARTLTFVGLTLWSGWHYRFRYLALAYLGMVAAFTSMLLLNHLWLVIGVQVFFGWCIGLIYYSSLYYSMHVGDTKAEHGGMHEAAIGMGIFGGPAIGAASVYLFPRGGHSSVLGVAMVVATGFAALLLVRRSARKKKPLTSTLPMA